MNFKYNQSKNTWKHKYQGRKRKVDLSEDQDNPIHENKAQAHGNKLKYYYYGRYYSFPWTSYKKLDKWLKGFIGKNINTVYSKYIHQLKKSKTDFVENRNRFWENIEKKDEIKYKGFYLNPDNTLGWINRGKKPINEGPEFKCSKWNWEHRKYTRELINLCKNFEDGKPKFFGNYYLERNFDELKAVFIFPKKLWNEVEMWPESDEDVKFSLDDKTYIKLKHDYRLTYLAGLGFGIKKSSIGQSSLTYSHDRYESEFIYLKK